MLTLSTFDYTFDFTFQNIINKKMAECNLIKKPLGLGNCPSMPGYYKSMFTTKNNFFIPAATIAAGNAAILAFLQDAMVDVPANRIYKWPTFFNNTPESEETIYQTTPLGKRKVRDGFYEWLINFSDSLCSHKAMYTHRATNGRVIFIDTDNQLNGTFDEAGNFYGLSVMMLNTEKMLPNTGSEVAMSPVRIVLSDNLEFDRDGALLPVSSLNTLDVLTEATLTVVGDPTDTEIVVDVTVACDGTPLMGLGSDDFVFLDANGDDQPVTAVEGDDGRYTLTGSGLESGTLNLENPSDLAVTAYEGFGIQISIAS